MEGVEYTCIFPALPLWDTAALRPILHPILISPFPNADVVFAYKEHKAAQQMSH